MKVVCAWCKGVIKDGPAEPISHGICAECAGNMRRELSKMQAALCSRKEETSGQERHRTEG